MELLPWSEGKIASGFNVGFLALELQGVTRSPSSFV